VLVYKTKSHSKQQTGVNCLTNFEMPDLIFSLTSQCHKTIILHIVFKKEKSYLACYRLTTSQCRFS